MSLNIPDKLPDTKLGEAKGRILSLFCSAFQAVVGVLCFTANNASLAYGYENKAFQAVFSCATATRRYAEQGDFQSSFVISALLNSDSAIESILSQSFNLPD